MQTHTCDYCTPGDLDAFRADIRRLLAEWDAWLASLPPEPEDAAEQEAA